MLATRQTVFSRYKGRVPTGTASVSTLGVMPPVHFRIDLMRVVREALAGMTGVAAMAAIGFAMTTTATKTTGTKKTGS